MKSDLKVLFSSRFLLVLLLTSVFTRLLFQFAFAPQIPSKYRLDEGIYAFLAKYVEDGHPVEELPGNGAGLYNSSKTFILPSRALIKIGINELLALRITSTSAGLVSLIMLSLCIIAIRKLPNEKDGLAPLILNNSQRLILIIFAFLPSNFIWSNLGLRESASQLYLITFSYFSLKLLHPKVDRRPLYSVLSSISLMLAFGSRPQTAIVFSLLAFVFGSVLLWKLRNFWILLSIFVGFTSGLYFTMTPSIETKESLIATKISNSDSQSPGPIITESLEGIAKLCSETGQVVIYKGVTYLCRISNGSKVVERNILNDVQGMIRTLQNLEEIRNGQRNDANSAWPESTCNISIGKKPSQILCNLIELPYRLPTFLFRPLPLIDSGSRFLNLAGVENLLWLGLIIYAAFTAFKKRLNKESKFLVVWLYSYILTFATAASLYEGNFGTAFRHKSSILWALALGLLISQKDFELKGRDSNLFKYRHSKKE